MSKRVKYPIRSGLVRTLVLARTFGFDPTFRNPESNRALPIHLGTVENLPFDFHGHIQLTHSNSRTNGCVGQSRERRSGTITQFPTRQNRSSLRQCFAFISVLVLILLWPTLRPSCRSIHHHHHHQLYDNRRIKVTMSSRRSARQRSSLNPTASSSPSDETTRTPSFHHRPSDEDNHDFETQKQRFRIFRRHKTNTVSNDGRDSGDRTPHSKPPSGRPTGRSRGENRSHNKGQKATSKQDGHNRSSSAPSSTARLPSSTSNRDTIFRSSDKHLGVAGDGDEQRHPVDKSASFALVPPTSRRHQPVATNGKTRQKRTTRKSEPRSGGNSVHRTKRSEGDIQHAGKQHVSYPAVQPAEPINDDSSSTFHTGDDLGVNVGVGIPVENSIALLPVGNISDLAFVVGSSERDSTTDVSPISLSRSIVDLSSTDDDEKDNANTLQRKRSAATPDTSYSRPFLRTRSMVNMVEGNSNKSKDDHDQDHDNAEGKKVGAITTAAEATLKMQVPSKPTATYNPNWLSPGTSRPVEASAKLDERGTVPRQTSPTAVVTSMIGGPYDKYLPHYAASTSPSRFSTVDRTEELWSIIRQEASRQHKCSVRHPAETPEERFPRQPNRHSRGVPRRAIGVPSVPSITHTYQTYYNTFPFPIGMTMPIEIISHGFRVKIIDIVRKVFVVDLLSPETCQYILHATAEHDKMVQLTGDWSRGWRTMFTWTKMDLPCADIPSLKGVVGNILNHIRRIVGEIYQDPEGAAKLRPRGWKEPHLLLYQKKPYAP